jgi:hypothetical protein
MATTADREEAAPVAPTIESLAARVFADRDATHRAHWATASYSAHMALGELYKALPYQMDEIVEVYQGAFSLIGPFAVECEPVDAIVPYLTDSVEWIEASRNAISRGNTAVQNLIDGLVGEYRRALYKLKNLM